MRHYAPLVVACSILTSAAACTTVEPATQAEDDQTSPGDAATPSDAGALPRDSGRVEADDAGDNAPDASVSTPTPCDVPGLQVIDCSAPQPRGITVSGTNIYWAAGGTIWRAHKDNGTPEELWSPNHAKPELNPWFVAMMSGERVAYSVPGVGAVSILQPNGVHRHVATGRDNPTFVSVFGEDVWWADTVDFGYVYRNDVRFGSREGGASFGYPKSVLADATHFYVGGIRSNLGIEYHDDGSQGTLASDTGNMDMSGYRFAQDEQYTYWAGFSRSAPYRGEWILVKRRKDGSGGLVKLMDLPPMNHAAVTIDDTHVFVIVGEGLKGSIRSVAKSGDASTVRIIAENQASPFDIAVDDTRVYWTTVGPAATFSGSVMAAAK